MKLTRSCQVCADEGGEPLSFRGAQRVRVSMGLNGWYMIVTSHFCLRYSADKSAQWTAAEPLRFSCCIVLYSEYFKRAVTVKLPCNRVVGKVAATR